MIKKLNHINIAVAKQIRAVFQASYAVEAKLLKAKTFPPLQRKLNEFTNSENSFYGFFKNDEMVAVVEIKESNFELHIQSLVVHPLFFKQGIASTLLNFLFNNFFPDQFMVETGVDNTPAIALYLKHSFIEVKQWSTNYGIRKVRFIKK